MSEGSKLWGGRFSGGKEDPIFHELNFSIDVDKRMWRQDIQGSKAYSKAINGAGLITGEELQQIHTGLDQIYAEFENGTFELNEKTDEDIHTAVERRLTELIGDTARKLHTGRSRNDQVATDMRLWLRDQIGNLTTALTDVIQALVERAETEIDIILPGYTHLQRAQPVRWSHWLMSYAWSLQSDIERLEEVRRVTEVLPLGSGALAGNPFAIDRRLLAKDLNFPKISHNSLQAVADRDFVVQFLYWASMLGLHLSRLAEDLILYSSAEFKYITLSDIYATGSSLMPQKKNPDGLELIRGKSGTLFGKLAGFMMTLKGLPSTYNKDLQEDKKGMFEAYDTVLIVLGVLEGSIQTLKVHKNKCEEALSPDMLATDLAYYLVRKGVPFREAHGLAGKVVALAESKGVPMTQLAHQDIQTVSPSFEEDVLALWNYENSVEQYQASGGTSKASVLEQISDMKTILQNYKQ